MRKNHFIALLFALVLGVFSTALASTAKKPTLMVLPSDHWCYSRYFSKTIDNMGEEAVINDYQAAFREDYELSVIITKIGQIFSKYGYQLKDYSQEAKKIKDRGIEEEVTYSKNGSMVRETPLDVLRRVSAHDIEICIDWDIVASNGKGNQTINFTLEAFDAYTSKRIASVNGSTSSNSEDYTVVLEKGIKKQAPKFDKALDNYFSDLKKNGREVILSVKTWDSSDIDLESEFDDEELITIIEDWLEENTVKGAFNTSSATESRALFEQVRVPLYDENDHALDARRFANQLRKTLKKAPYNIESKVMSRGLGEAILIIGEK